jgi:hypothetical protein
MRDNHKGYPQLLTAYERDGLYFGVVRLSLLDQTASFEFGLDHAGYRAFRRILEARPFTNAPGLNHSFYLAGNYTRRKLNEERVSDGIRVEEGANAKNFDFDCPTSLAANLLWFFSLKNIREAGELRRVPE